MEIDIEPILQPDMLNNITKPKISQDWVTLIKVFVFMCFAVALSGPSLMKLQSLIKCLESEGNKMVLLTKIDWWIYKVVFVRKLFGDQLIEVCEFVANFAFALWLLVWTTVRNISILVIGAPSVVMGFWSTLILGCR